MDSYITLNETLVNLFHDIMDIEEKAIITQEFRDTTNNNTHVIEAIGLGELKNMSSIARELSVAVGVLTIAMNSLVKGGYVIRERGKEDRHVVYISLSDEDRVAYEHHTRFHETMIEGITEELTQEKMEVLIKTLTRLNRWLRSFQEN